MKPINGPYRIERKTLDPKLMGLDFPIQQKIAVIKTDDNLKLAEVFDTGFPDLNETQLNLFAAAPELLEALTLALNTLKSSGFKDQAELSLIKDTIKKATGA